MTQIIVGENEGMGLNQPYVDLSQNYPKRGFFQISTSTVTLKRLSKSANAKQLPSTNSVREVSAIDNNYLL